MRIAVSLAVLRVQLVCIAIASFASLRAWEHWLLVLLAVSPALLGCGSSDLHASQHIDEARFLLDDSEKPPQQSDPRWQRVSLPDAWREQRPGVGGVGWYLLDVPRLPPAGERWAILLPLVNMNAAVFLGDLEVGTGGRFVEPVAHNFNRPLLFSFPSDLLEQQRGTIAVRLFAYPHHYGVLGPSWVGDESLLRGPYERRLALQSGLSQLSTVIAWVAAIFIGALWIGTRFDGAYGWFAATLLLWSVASLNYWVRDIPVSHWSWDRVVNPALECFAVALAIWARRFVGIGFGRADRALLGFAGTSIAVMAFVPIQVFYAVANSLHIVSVGIGAYATVRLLSRMSTVTTWEKGLYWASGMLGLLFAAHDLALQLAWFPGGPPFLIPYIVPVMLLGFGSSLVARFVASLDRAEAQSRELEQRVQAKSDELARNYERLRDLERQRTIASERERIMREMHDGLGGHLVSTLARVEGRSATLEDAAEGLRMALADMRVVIDSLDPGLPDLAALLGVFRGRMSPLLEDAGIDFSWRSELSAREFGPETSLQVLRILQEIFTNAIRHAQAQSIRLEAREEPGYVTIDVRDDGHGFDPAPAHGRGLENIRHRANQIGAELQVSSDASGTRILLSLPLSENDSNRRDR